MAIHSSVLTWRIPQTEEPGRQQSMSHKELDTTEQLTLSLLKHTYTLDQLKKKNFWKVKQHWPK